MGTLDRRLAALGCLLTLSAPSCILRGPEDLRRELTDVSGVRLEKEVGVSIGRFGMVIARMAHRMAGEPEISLRGVKKVQVGVYSVVDPGDGTRLPPLELSGWELFLTVREQGEDIQMLIREEDDSIRGLLVVVAESDEWVLVRVKGKLDRVFESALELALDEAERPDLHEEAVTEYNERRERNREGESPYSSDARLSSQEYSRKSTS